MAKTISQLIPSKIKNPETLESLNWPTVEFTHTDLAAFNGIRKNQTVWERWLFARKIGKVIPTGTRRTTPGKRGMGPVLFKLNPDFTMALMVVKPQPAAFNQVMVINPQTKAVAELSSAVVQNELQDELAAVMASA